MGLELLWCLVMGCGGPRVPQPQADPETSTSLQQPSEAQISARLVEVVERGDRGRQEARDTLTAWHRSHDIGATVADLATTPGLGTAHRGAAATLLVQWGDPRAVETIRALAESTDPSLAAAGLAATTHLAEAGLQELVVAWTAHPDPRLSTWAAEHRQP